MTHRYSMGQEIVRLVAGLADLGLEQAENAAHAARALIGRSDLRELAGDCRSDLSARGAALIGRFGPPPQAHMETLAQRAAAREDAVDA